MGTERELGRFEQRLLVELQREVVTRQAEQRAPEAPRRGRRRYGPTRRPAVVAGLAAVATVAIAAGVPFLDGGGTTAYAVSRHADGTVTVQINDLRDAAGLERQLRAAGVPAVVRYLPIGKACQEPWFRPWTGISGPSSNTLAVGSDGSARFTIDTPTLPPDVTVVITTQTDAPAGAASGPTNASAIAFAYAQGAVGPCTVVDAPAGQAPPGAPPAGRSGGSGTGLSSSRADAPGAGGATSAGGQPAVATAP